MNDFICRVSEKVFLSYYQAIRKKSEFSLVLSGGKTPKFLFNAWSKQYTNIIDWRKVHLFWLDERCTSPHSEDSNFGLAQKHLLNSIQPASLHRIQGELEPNIAAELYEAELKLFFQAHDQEYFDLILLGMGEDGHIASIFPNSNELYETQKMVVATQKKYNGYHRVTLTLPIINRSKKVLMINSKKKFDIYNSNGTLPIHFVKKGNLEVVIHKKVFEK